jgi:hypothetical protein
MATTEYADFSIRGKSDWHSIKRFKKRDKFIHVQRLYYG